jgi:hypothetical protein
VSIRGKEKRMLCQRKETEKMRTYRKEAAWVWGEVLCALSVQREVSFDEGLFHEGNGGQSVQEERGDNKVQRRRMEGPKIPFALVGTVLGGDEQKWPLVGK